MKRTRTGPGSSTCTVEPWLQETWLRWKQKQLSGGLGDAVGCAESSVGRKRCNRKRWSP